MGASILPLHLNHFALSKVYCTNLQYHTLLNKMVLLNKKTKPLSKLHKVCFIHPITHSFWVEIIYISCYIQNQIPISSTKNTTPYEIWRHRKLTSAHLHVFECCNPSLGLTTKARGCKVASQAEHSGVTSHAPRSAKSVREWTLTLPSELPCWELESQMDSHIFKVQLQSQTHHLGELFISL
jgi:hypothetical protein